MTLCLSSSKVHLHDAVVFHVVRGTQCAIALHPIFNWKIWVFWQVQDLKCRDTHRSKYGLILFVGKSSNAVAAQQSDRPVLSNDR